MTSRVALNIAGTLLIGSTLCATVRAGEPSAAPHIQSAAQLHDTEGTIKDLPKTINTLDLVAESHLQSGVDIKIWRYATKYGEGGCDQGGQVGLDAKTCPRFGLLISTRWEMEDNSKFALWFSDPRRWWRLSDADAKNPVGALHGSGEAGSLTLYACEASMAVDTGKVDPSATDNWHAVPYRLSVGPYNKARLERLPDPSPQKNCWSDDKSPVLVTDKSQHP
jgi:hypothetical protein